MKKFILFILLFLFAANFSYADDRTNKPYNIGYADRYGMVGLYGHLSDYIGKEWGDLSPGGGGFIYYNIFNKFWGNVSIGVSADYVGGDFTTKNGIKGKAHMAPLALNLAYMTFRDEAADVAEENEQFLEDYEDTRANYESNLKLAQDTIANLQAAADKALENLTGVVKKLNEYEEARDLELTTFS